MIKSPIFLYLIGFGFVAGCARPYHKVIRTPFYMSEEQAEENKDQEAPEDAESNTITPGELVLPENVLIPEEQDAAPKEKPKEENKAAEQASGNNNTDTDDKTPTSPQAESEKIPLEKAGQIIPTIYYLPQIQLARCAKNEKLIMARDHKSKQPVVELCESDIKNCRLQGSCIVKINSSRKITLNYKSNPRNEYLFRVNTFLNCQFARGATGDCLLPFYSIAADPNIYKMNQKIYIPKVKGTPLPDGSLHTGVFIIQDTGGNIDGKGRFDFFTGLMKYTDKNNPFYKLGLSDKKTRMDFYLID